MNNLVYWLIRGQIHLGISRGAKMSLASNELKWIPLHSTWNTISDHGPQVGSNH